MSFVLASFTPGFFWLWFFLRQDKIRPEPHRLIAITFILGCVSTIPAGIGNYVFGADRLLGGTPALASVVAAMMFVVGPVEELCKFGAVRLGPYRSLYFDEPVDGLVYSFAASLGFASLENLFYVLQHGPEVMLLRAPLSTVGHLVFGSIWGYALGQYYVSNGRQRTLLFGSLAMAAGAHALFNVLVFSFLTCPPRTGPSIMLVLGRRKGGKMAKKRHTPEQVINKLREAEVAIGEGSTVAEVARRIGVTEQTFYRWRSEYGGLRIDQARRLKRLELENSRLKRAVADLTLDNQILREASEGNF